MKIQRLFSILLFCSMLGSGSLMAQSMSDSQVLEYVKDGIRQGKEQKQLASELARKGVTKEQAMRVKQLYEQQNNVNTSQSTGTDINESRLREETKENTSDMLEDHPTTEDLAREDQVFGRNIFNTRNLTFEPSVNLATPANYRLGPGDEVIIDIWGASQNTIRQQISPEGTINIQKIGPVNLSGMTVSAANDYLKNALNKIYNGLNNTTDPTSDIRLTLGNIRTIQINVMGEVVQPGTYALSSFSTVFHALYRAGGVSDIGSLRNVQLVRNGKNIATIDVYEFIMKGNTQDDIRLQEGDVVIVPAYDVLVKISGKVKRPMRFEMKKEENLATLIKYAGGFEADAYTRSLRVVRQNGEEYEVNTVKDMDYSIYTMRNGDVVTAEAILNRFTNKLEIRGAVYRPGIYQLSGKLNTIRELVHEAQGLTGDAFLNRAVLYRQREDLTSEVVQIDIKSIMNGTSPNLALMKNDILYIPSIHDLEDRGNMSTDCVFSGRRGTYNEASIPDGETYYDRTKALGEVNDSRNLTFRNSIVGPDMYENGIGLFNWFMKQNAPIGGYTKAVWTGVTTLTLAKAMDAALETNLSGLYNLVNNDTISKYELLGLFNKYFKDGKLQINENPDFICDKSLVNNRKDFPFIVPSYEIMVQEMHEWIISHKELYPHYF